MRATDAEIVRALPLFGGMQDAHFEALIGAGYLQRFPQGVVLIHEGERPDFLHVLVQGSVEFFSESADRATTLSLLKPPSAFILAAVVLDQLYLKSARTVEPSVVVLIPAQAVRDVFDKDPAFARAVVAELAFRYRNLVKDLKNQRLRTSLERLANWIIAHDEQMGRTGSFKLPIEKKVLANLLGMRPENLSRNLAELARVGVHVRGSIIDIRDIEALKAFARPDPLIDDPAV
ncbi:MAG: helix-turn-helix domain-containing protein [Hyphomicrobiaceae bacterium]|nr:MAG: helix-turn-helix domain-containing protein [Hyphomicrobiaceae bacterium]